MIYNDFRHFADSWGLVFMTCVFLAAVGWTFRRGAGSDHARASTMIFQDEDGDLG